MPDNSSGFVDFNEYSNLNSGEEQRLLDESVQRAQDATTKEKQALRTSEIDAGRSNTGLSETLSYSDYLKASREAASAWAAVTSRSRDPRAAALQGSIGQDAKAQAAAAGVDSATRLTNIGRRVDQGRWDAAASRAAREDYERKQAEAAADRQRQTDEARESYIQSMSRGAYGRAAAGGAQRDYVGSWNPYADSDWAVQQGGWEAQQLKNAGGTDAQQQGVWNAYTGKGSRGNTGAAASAGAKGRNPYANMLGAMEPYAPPKQDEED